MLNIQNNLKSLQIDRRSAHILQLYNAWNAELDAIGQEAQHLRGEIQKVIDKKQMFRILQKLNDGHH